MVAVGFATEVGEGVGVDLAVVADAEVDAGAASVLWKLSAGCEF